MVERNNNVASSFVGYMLHTFRYNMYTESEITLTRTPFVISNEIVLFFKGIHDIKVKRNQTHCHKSEIPENMTFLGILLHGLFQCC
jgi:hypothetical protein